MWSNLIISQHNCPPHLNWTLNHSYEGESTLLLGQNNLWSSPQFLVGRRQGTYDLGEVDDLQMPKPGNDSRFRANTRCNRDHTYHFLWGYIFQVYMSTAHLRTATVRAQVCTLLLGRFALFQIALPYGDGCPLNFAHSS